MDAALNTNRFILFEVSKERQSWVSLETVGFIITHPMTSAIERL